ncbi:MAG TPA: hypothetical protein VHF27_11880 [Acidimicrobiales bacterium]|nr:hypothetical protein [Acidimicrobiales bacterium]
MARISGQNLVATFPDLDKANDAALALSRAGIEADRISILGREQEEAASDPDTRLRDMEATGEVAKKAGAAGAAGAALGALAGAAAFAIPGVGPVIGSGIWAGILAGGAAGGAVGGMVGGVSVLSMEEFDLKYQGTLREGKAMVAVAVDDDESAAEARALLEKEIPEDVHMIDSQGQRIGEE